MGSDEVTTTLTGLIEGCNHNAQTLRSAGQRARSGEVCDMLDRRAEECADAAHKLQLELDRAGGREPAAHGPSDLEILEQCEASEDRVKARYEEALGRSLPEAIGTVVRKQHEGVLHNHQQIKDLRDRLRAQA